jgi:hypothetical protein
MAQVKREHQKALYRSFQRFALEDQRKYYERTSARYRKAASQVNVLRAFFSFLTGLSSALAGVLVAAYLVPGSFANNGACATQDVIITVEQASQTIPGGEPASSAPTSVPDAAIDSLNLSPEQYAIAQDASSVGYCGTLKLFVSLLTIIAVVAPALGAAGTTLADLYQWDRMTSIYDAALENIEVADAQSPLDDMDDLTYRAALRAMIEGTLTVMSDETAQWGQSVRTPAQLEKFVEEERERAERTAGVRDESTPTTPATTTTTTPSESDSVG